MATQNGRISLSLQDITGSKSTWISHVTVDDTMLLSDAYSAIAAAATLYRTVGDAAILEGTFSLLNKAVAVSAASGSNVGGGAVFDFKNTTNLSTYGQYIPSFLRTLVTGAGQIVVTDTVPAAYIAAMTGVVLGGRYTNPVFIANATCPDAFPTTRKLRSK